MSTLISPQLPSPAQLTEGDDAYGVRTLILAMQDNIAELEDEVDARQAEIDELYLEVDAKDRLILSLQKQVESLELRTSLVPSFSEVPPPRGDTPACTESVADFDLEESLCHGVGESRLRERVTELEEEREDLIDELTSHKQISEQLFDENRTLRRMITSLREATSARAQETAQLREVVALQAQTIRSITQK
ncbi:hypothetical protein GMRT_12093 [Giardia muris]|uniref:Uncharacterized protein n=1 Tax=Giardia muris TaxID=5742 RepID=A0A4Z1SMX1_GIAMU|nr:hypothetical protein GMRT_12093 [Giardia muris]|eukprot:TNJ27046.1 hypothetical protein GMRT_12093 [Giardia muris]